MSKTNEEILAEISDYSVRQVQDHPEWILSFRMALEAMTAARGDERERMRLMIQKRIDELRFIIDHDQFKSPYYGEMLITELKKLITCT